MNANCILRAMTLRGIGSYLHGARLEIRPLTILCGTNGSGKSTWFKVLNMLKESTEDCSFPFLWSIDDWDVEDIELTNSLLHLLTRDEISHFTDKTMDHDFGPPCTIGLEFEAAQNFDLPPIKHADIDPSVIAQQFLWLGRCVAGTRFSVRLSHPTNWGDEEPIPGLYHLVELRLNDQFLIRFSTKNSWDTRYTFECSPAFLSGFSAFPEDRALEIAEVSCNLEEVSPVASIMDLEDAQLIVKSAAKRIRELLAELLSGYFYVSAIRDTHRYKSLFDSKNIENFDRQDAIDAAKKRYVGEKGAATWWLERQFAFNPMAPVPADSQSDSASDKLPDRFISKWSEVFGMPFREDLLFEGFVSKWSEALLRTKIQIHASHYASHSLSSVWADSLSGFLVSEKPPKDEDLDKLDVLHNHYASLARLEHPCFRFDAQNPKQMSSGFHQLMPLIVQLGLMRQCEIMAVENPEVHLHPSLQLQVAEFLMHQANAGKWIIVETHSDLIIRRIIREILEEEIAIGQQKISINFANIQNSEDGYHYSTLEPIAIDEETGRIANWPSGFLDDDIRESGRLFDIMYGIIPDKSESAGEDEL